MSKVFEKTTGKIVAIKKSYWSIIWSPVLVILMLWSAVGGAGGGSWCDPFIYYVTVKVDSINKTLFTRSFGRFPIGDDVYVRYNPNNPKKCKIKRIWGKSKKIDDKSNNVEPAPQ